MTHHMSKSEAYQLARRLLHDNDLTGWKIVWDTKRKTAGWCQHSTKTIGFSTYLLAHREYMESWQTVTHEVAHAMSGPLAGHGIVWQRNHRALGGNARQCFEFKNEAAPWISRCPEGCFAQRYRKPRTLVGWKCRKHRHDMVWVDQRKSTIAAQKESSTCPIVSS